MHPGHWWEKEEAEKECIALVLKKIDDSSMYRMPDFWALPTEKELREANRKMRARGSHHNHNRRKNKMPAR